MIPTQRVRFYTCKHRTRTTLTGINYTFPLLPVSWEMPLKEQPTGAYIRTYVFFGQDVRVTCMLGFVRQCVGLHLSVKVIPISYHVIQPKKLKHNYKRRFQGTARVVRIMCLHVHVYTHTIYLQVVYYIPFRCICVSFKQYTHP